MLLRDLLTRADLRPLDLSVVVERGIVALVLFAALRDAPLRADTFPVVDRAAPLRGEVFPDALRAAPERADTLPVVERAAPLLA